MSSASTTAACGPTTVSTTSNTDRPATARSTRPPAQVSSPGGADRCHLSAFNLHLLGFFFAAVVFGDPHFVTFDGVSYSFNGKGEYNLMYSASKQLSIQGRTEPVSGEGAA